MKYLAQIGAGLIALAMVLTLMSLTWVALAVFVVVGIVDIYLEVTDKETISQWIHRLFPKQIDIGIAIALLILTWWIWGPAGFLPVLMGVIVGHLFWNKD